MRRDDFRTESTCYSFFALSDVCCALVTESRWDETYVGFVMRILQAYSSARESSQDTNGYTYEAPGARHLVSERRRPRAECYSIMRFQVIEREHDSGKLRILTDPKRDFEILRFS